MLEFLETYQDVIALSILLGLFALFALEKYPPEVTAAGAAGLFIVLGYVPFDDVMASFSNPAPITIAAMFVLSGALVRTGMLDALASAVIGRAGARPWLGIAVFLAATMLASAFVNNTPVVLVLIPVVIRLAHSLNMAPTRLLIPLSYAAILGGMCTLIGTSTNLLVDGIARNAGLQAFTIFEITPVGLIAAATGGGVMFLLGPFLLPDRAAGAGSQDEETDYLSEATLLEDSDFIGRKLGDIAAFHHKGVRVTGVRSGAEIRRGDIDDHRLSKGDTVIFIATTSELLTLSEKAGLRVGMRRTVELDQGETSIVAEAMVAPSHAGTRQRIADLQLGRRYGMRVLGANRHNHIPGPDLAGVRLRPADKLLLEGPEAGLETLTQSGELVSIARPSGRAYRRRQAPVAVAALVGVVALAAFNVAPIGILALIAVAVILVLRCIDNDEAWNSIDGSILILIFSMLIVGVALERTGAAVLIVETLTPLIAGLPPLLMLLAIYYTASVMTELITNNAVAVVLTPIVIGMAGQLGVDPRPLVVTVMIAASASFATPIGYQTNTLVYGAGDYRFTDFLKVGLPMNLIVGLMACMAITVFFPL